MVSKRRLYALVCFAMRFSGKNLYPFFKSKNIPVIRMGLQATEDLAKNTTILAGPFHPAFGHMVHSEIFMDMAASLLEAERGSCDKIIINVHPRSISKMRGLKNKNVESLEKKISNQIPQDYRGCFPCPR